MQIYKTKATKFAGTDFREVHQQALSFYGIIKRKTKRRPYVRSAYFKKEKIFIDLFWHHLFEKSNWRDRIRRVKYFACGIDLIKQSRFAPKTKENPNKPSELLHRFYGMTPDNELFYVQIKEDKRTGQKFLLSIFPEK